MAVQVAHEQRVCPRLAVAVDVHLGRKVGADVVAKTHDISVHGARVVTDRPLRVDEELQFDLDVQDAGVPKHISGTARVLRQHRHDMYALRFEQFDPADREVLSHFVGAGIGVSAHTSVL